MPVGIHDVIKLPLKVLYILVERAVSWLLNNLSFLVIFSTNDLRAPEKTLQSSPEIDSWINFSWRVVLGPFYSCLCISQCGLTSGMSCRLTFERIDRQPPSTLGEQKRQMWGAVMWRRKRACDWYGCQRERSEPCLKKRSYRFCCPLNKQRDISAVTHSDSCQPLQNNSSHQRRLAA